MSELAYAAKILGNLPDNVIIDYPSGRYGFVGRVDARLAYERLDGSPCTEEDLEKARQFGPRLAGVKGRSWPTKADAVAAAEAIGVEYGFPVPANA